MECDKKIKCDKCYVWNDTLYVIPDSYVRDAYVLTTRRSPPSFKLNKLTRLKRWLLELIANGDSVIMNASFDGDVNLTASENHFLINAKFNNNVDIKTKP